MKIISVGLNEISIIKSLWEGLNAHHLSMSNKFKDFYTAFTFEDRIASLKKRDDLVVYVAQDGTQSIGYCIVSIYGAIGELDSIFVQPEHRGKGIGTELVTHSLKWLEGQSIETIRVAIAEGNESALGFYRRFGFTERMVLMQRTA